MAHKSHVLCKIHRPEVEVSLSVVRQHVFTSRIELECEAVTADIAALTTFSLVLQHVFSEIVLVCEACTAGFASGRPIMKVWFAQYTTVRAILTNVEPIKSLSTSCRRRSLRHRRWRQRLQQFTARPPRVSTIRQ